MTPHPISLLDAIAAHRVALVADEAAFDDNGQPIDLDLVHETGTAEMAAYEAFALAPCLTSEDIQQKIAYILNGSVGERDTLLDCLGREDYGGAQGAGRVYQVAAAAPARECAGGRVMDDETDLRLQAIETKIDIVLALLVDGSEKNRVRVIQMLQRSAQRQDGRSTSANARET